MTPPDVTAMPDEAACELFAVPVEALTMSDAVARVSRAVDGRERLLIGVVNAAKIVNMRRDEQLRLAVLSSDIILADGVSIVWASRLLGHPLPERVAGIDLMLRILEHGSTRGYRVYCLGAAVEVLTAAVDAISRRYQGITIAGAHHGYFEPDEEPAVAAAIGASDADVLFVAMSSPKKEQFLARWGATIGVPVCHGVGGSFDVLAGKVRRAPKAWQKAGFEWLYRTCQEPRRLFGRYLVTNTRFVGLVLTDLLRGLPGRFQASGSTQRPQ